jgi:hypothetical protein
MRDFAEGFHELKDQKDQDKLLGKVTNCSGTKMGDVKFPKRA